jgi:hypothetical protein
MLYDLITFKPYVCFDFQNLSIYDLICTTIDLYAKSIDYYFFLRFPDFLETAKFESTRHVRPRTYPADRTCPTLSSEIYDYRVIGYKKGASYPLVP